MKRSLLIAAACAAFAYSTTAFAQEFSGPCEDGCGTPTPSPPPPAPPPPGVGASRSGSFFVSSNSEYQQGQTYYPNGVPTMYIFGQGPGGTVLTDNPYSVSQGSATITLIDDAAAAKATAIAHQGDIYGRSDVTAALGYGTSFTAGSTAVADAIEAILNHSPLASLSGAYSITATGSGKGSVVARSDYANNSIFYTSCNYYNSTGPCTSGNWSINLGFHRGTEYTGGDANTFYATFSLGATAESGYAGCFLTSCPGDTTAWIDPTINYNAQLGQYANSLTFNSPGGLGNGGFSFVSGGAVPEPASWALMVGGFGMLGGAVRRRRVTFATA